MKINNSLLCFVLLAAGFVHSQSDNECSVNQDCLTGYGEGQCCGTVQCTVGSGRSSTTTDYTSRCYDATGLSGSSDTISYDGNADCTQTCTSYSDLSLSSTDADAGDGDGDGSDTDDSMTTPEVVARREFNCEESTS